MIHCYSQAAANTRLVGLEVARLVNVLVDQHGTDPLQVKVSCEVTKPPSGQVHMSLNLRMARFTSLATAWGLTSLAMLARGSQTWAGVLSVTG